MGGVEAEGFECGDDVFSGLGEGSGDSAVGEGSACGGFGEGVVGFGEGECEDVANGGAGDGGYVFSFVGVFGCAGDGFGDGYACGDEGVTEGCGCGHGWVVGGGVAWGGAVFGEPEHGDGGGEAGVDVGGFPFGGQSWAGGGAVVEGELPASGWWGGVFEGFGGAFG